MFDIVRQLYNDNHRRLNIVERARDREERERERTERERGRE